jgi:hypothetical protein
MTETPSFPDAEQTVQRVRELSERMIEVSKQNGLAWLEGYERALESMLRFQEQAAKGSQVEWINTLATTQADFVREMSKLYIGAMKEQLR